MPQDRAAQHLTATLERSRVSAVRRAARWVAALATSALGDAVDAPDVDLVVRRRDTGAEVLRTHADVAPAELLGRVQADLEAKSVAEFVAEWRLLEE